MAIPKSPAQPIFGWSMYLNCPHATIGWCLQQGTIAAMASSKDIQQTSRPLAHRSSPSQAPASGFMTTRQSHSRNNSHSILSTSLNANHRVTRRKSMSNPAANVAAVAAALKEAGGDGASAMSIRRHTISRGAVARGAAGDGLLSPPSSLPTHRFHMDKREVPENAIDDEPQDGSADEENTKLVKARARRASDGQALVKERRKSNRVELRCETCGKGYKHSSCLAKHLFVFPSLVHCLVPSYSYLPTVSSGPTEGSACVLPVPSTSFALVWEHTPEWSLTSKLLISKHQQVQLLEAASVLVAMNGKENEDATAAQTTSPPESARDFPSEPESTASPAVSGYSDSRHSSADTTPPPQLDGFSASAASGTFSKRYSSGSGFGFGRSYGSLHNPLVTGSMPNATGFSHFRQMSHDHRRPPSSGRNATGQEDRELAAAVELLSCSFNSNNGSRMANLSAADVPPVPPLPTQYLDQAASLSSTGFLSSYPARQPESFTRGEIRRGTKTEESDSIMDEDEFDRRSRSRSDEDDDGVFGRMEE
ncbi:hypothetical protein SODALDRAFT_320218 [Sodiomyces alkalinus F11]|uniref:C2H2-type domain-containing protein n=1 Tax=Sodiomyces alkalinus (strain CBS 110278 / VKM F-3762 / F11) TaxID=1314773 RepID=A0A3N2PMN4_SODAK|nr:hypothetical protein SODALDRAFT_320218 [Sodiomyces alkalinus F11]ROT35690.1 hypothetical protein SODALDRAFT_320218 [Sodiomyces alkalinus F11]